MTEDRRQPVVFKLSEEDRHALVKEIKQEILNSFYEDIGRTVVKKTLRGVGIAVLVVLAVLIGFKVEDFIKWVQ